MASLTLFWHVRKLYYKTFKKKLKRRIIEVNDYRLCGILKKIYFCKMIVDQGRLKLEAVIQNKDRVIT